MRRDSITTQQGDWQPFCETVGFIVRGLTYRTIKYHSKYGERSRHRVSDFYMVEFDILDGSSGYMTTGFWAFDASNRRPIGEPVGIPLALSEVLVNERIGTDLSVDEVKHRLLQFVHTLIN